MHTQTTHLFPHGLQPLSSRTAVKLTLALSVIIMIASLAYAHPPKSKSSTIRPRHTAAVSILLNAFDYKEDFPPPGKSEESGWLFGVALRYTYEGGSDLPLFGRMQFDFSPSGTEYGGNEETINGFTRDFTETTRNWFSRIEVDAGYVFHGVFGSPVDVTPYTGYGYRFWRRELSDHNNLSGYTEDYSWSYLPIGVKGTMALARNWSVGLEMALRIMVSGNILIGITNYNNPTLSLGNRLGWFMAVPVEYRIASGWGAAVSFWYEHSAIDESTKSPAIIVNRQESRIWEPPSRTHQYGFAFTGFYTF